MMEFKLSTLLENIGFDFGIVRFLYLGASCATTTACSKLWIFGDLELSGNGSHWVSWFLLVSSVVSWNRLRHSVSM
jgi:hypothetical protein